MGAPLGRGVGFDWFGLLNRGSGPRSARIWASRRISLRAASCHSSKVTGGVSQLRIRTASDRGSPLLNLSVVPLSERWYPALAARWLNVAMYESTSLPCMLRLVSLLLASCSRAVSVNAAKKSRLNSSQSTSSVSSILRGGWVFSASAMAWVSTQSSTLSPLT